MILKKYRVKMKMVNEKCQGWVQNRPANGSLPTSSQENTIRYQLGRYKQR